MSTEQSSGQTWSNFRRLLLRLHLWIGIAFSIPFVILGVTGAYLVYDQDFTAPPRATAAGEHKAPTAIIAAALADDSGPTGHKPQHAARRRRSRDRAGRARWG